MGQNAAETVTRIEETRDRLENDLRELEDRLPRTAVWGKRAAGLAVGGGAAGTAVVFTVRRLHKRRHAKQAQQPVQAVIQVLPEDWAKRVSASLEDGSWRPWAAAAGGAWLLAKLMELRQLRRLALAAR